MPQSCCSLLTTFLQYVSKEAKTHKKSFENDFQSFSVLCSMVFLGANNIIPWQASEGMIKWNFRRILS